MHDYDHFRGYLHSKNLRWSYGTIKNRDGDRAQAVVAALPTEQFVQALAFAGFSGIYFDRDGYEDGGAAQDRGTVQHNSNRTVNQSERPAALFQSRRLC